MLIRAASLARPSLFPASVGIAIRASHLDQQFVALRKQNLSLDSGCESSGVTRL